MNRFTAGSCHGRGEAEMKLDARGRRWLRLAAMVAACGASIASVSPASAGVPHVPAGRSALMPTALRVDTLHDPVGLGDPSPRLSWNLASDGHDGWSAGRQTGYEIRVASTVARLGRADLWDSGKVASNATGNVTYRGTPLRSRQGAVWQVRVWDADGRPSGWSGPASWEMGLLNQADWSARWIEDPGYTYAT